MLKASAHDDIVDLIYDAPFEPNRWIGVMERLCDRVGSHTACLTELDIVNGGGEGITARADQSSINDYLANWTDRNPLLLVDDPAAYARDWRLTILRDQEWVRPDLLYKTSYYNDFLRPLGAEHSIFVRLSLEGTSVTALNIARIAGRGAFQDWEMARIGAYQSHLIRAVGLGRRLRLSQAALDAMDTMLETNASVLFFVDRAGKVLRFTAAAETLLRTQNMLTMRQSRLQATDLGVDIRLQHLIRASFTGVGLPLDPTITIQSAIGGKRLVISASRLGPRSVGAFTSEPLVLVGVAEASPAVSQADRLRGAYGLTAAEARVALLMGEGAKIPEIASRSGSSVHTVRAQLGAIFAKTGSHRQADLVRLLLQQGMAGPRA